jgi:hypothetical protein
MIAHACAIMVMVVYLRINQTDDIRLSACQKHGLEMGARLCYFMVFLLIYDELSMCIL